TATVSTATEGTPEHCRVSGQILPEIRFEVNLPASWNRRLSMFGNGGFAGEHFDADYRAASRDRALKYGFAVAATNTGHDANAEPLVRWLEKRVVPERIIGSRIVEGKTIGTRALCPYPQVARYTGTGSIIDDAAHF